MNESFLRMGGVGAVKPTVHRNLRPEVPRFLAKQNDDRHLRRKHFNAVCLS